MAGERTPNRNRISYSECQHSLFIYPSNGPNSVLISEKLVGAKTIVHGKGQWRTIHILIFKIHRLLYELFFFCRNQKCCIFVTQNCRCLIEKAY